MRGPRRRRRLPAPRRRRHGRRPEHRRPPRAPDARPLEPDRRAPRAIRPRSRRRGRGGGPPANDLKGYITTRLAERLAEVAVSRRPAGAVDVTLPGRAPSIGHRHPLTLVREAVETIFARMGFLVIEGPELEDDYHNFEALNMPADHPARDMQDTLYLADPLETPTHTATLLRTHTSGMQI